ncbi:MAG TPA: hypothetical protein VG798_01025 [Rhizomicrobium sp.]|nr:hypothetical protein [Rhizomicrobium sp.]
MKSLWIAAAIALAAGPAMADAMTPARAMSHQGERVAVEGTAHVQQSAGGDVEFVLSDNGKGHLVINVQNQARADLPDLTSFDGKVVNVVGVVDFGSHGAQITVERAAQLKLASP